MAGYLVFDIDVRDPALYQEYALAVRDLLPRMGGKVTVKSDRIVPLEGGWTPKLIIVAEFETAAKAREFYDSPEYKDLMIVRDRSALSRGILVDGAP